MQQTQSLIGAFDRIGALVAGLARSLQGVEGTLPRCEFLLASIHVAAGPHHSAIA
jgi:hypothetical protein